MVKIPELQENMFQLATEMERAGLVEEIVSDGLALTDVSGVLLMLTVLSLLTVSCSVGTVDSLALVFVRRLLLWVTVLFVY